MKYGEQIIKAFDVEKDLEIWSNQHKKNYVIKLTLPEFCCLCPRSGYPDFATIYIDYIPNELVVELINFKYPFSSMVVQTDNSTLSIIMTIIGLISVSFILWGVLNFINNLVKKNIFTKNTVKTLTVLGLGLIILGIVHIIIEYIDKTHHYGIGTPLLSILIGIIILFIREIFSEGKNIQEENDLTI